MSSTDANPDPTAAISVIIPVYNDAPGLTQTVESLLAADMAQGDEIIIVDNGSGDDTYRVARTFDEDHPGRVAALLEDSIQGSYAARNRGIEAADGDILAFIDADMTVPEDYFSAVRARFEDGDVDYLGCDVRIVVGDPTPAGHYNGLTGFPIQAYIERGRYAPTCCLCIRRDCIDRIGPFDHRLESGGDMEFGKRAHAAGLTQKFAEEITLHHPARTEFQALINKQRRIGRGHAQLSHHHSERFSLLTELYLTPWKYFLPHNPLKLRSQCRERGWDIGVAVLLTIAFWRIPLAWAGLAAYLGEARRLSAGR